jgi:hypothetical protein
MGLFGTSATSVIKKGQRFAGTVTGIYVEIKTHEDAADTIIHRYAIRTTDGSTIGVQQAIEPVDSVRLGMLVEGWVRDADAVIDAERTLGPSGSSDLSTWKAGKDVPAAGIVDRTLRLDRAAKKGVRGTAIIDAVGTRSAAFGLAKVPVLTLHVMLDGDSPYEVEVDLGRTPFYASHLVRAQQRVPVWVERGRLDKVVVDWPQAAVEDPGVGVGAAFEPSSTSGLTSLSASGIESALGGSTIDGPKGAAPSNVPDPIHGVSFEQWVAIESDLAREGAHRRPSSWDTIAARHGVAPGCYAKAVSRWGMTMATRPDLASYYAEHVTQ